MQSRFNSPAHPLKGPAKVDILGYPEAFQIGEKSRMYTAEETTIITIGDNISQSHKSENSRSVVLLTNDNGGIQSGNSGGPVVSIGNGTVVGIAIRGLNQKTEITRLFVARWLTFIIGCIQINVRLKLCV